MPRQLALVILLLALAGRLLGEDWPQFRGPSGQGLSSETGVPLGWGVDQGFAWKAEIPGEGWSSPIVRGGRVFVTAATEGGQALHLIGLDAESGAVRFDREVVRQRIEGRKEPTNSYATPTPTSDAEHVYVLAFDGSLAAVTLDGTVSWVNRDHRFSGQHGIGVSPRLYDDLVVVPFDGSSDGADPMLGWKTPWEEAVILALDRHTGQVRWKGRRGPSRIGHVTPNLAREGDHDVLVSAAGDVVQGFDLRNGERLWTVRAQGEGVVPSIVVGDGMVFSASGWEKPTVRAIRTGGRGDVTQTHVAWESTRNVPMIPSFLLVGPHLFTISESGLAMCLEAASGKVPGRQRIGGNPSASPVYADGRIYFLSEEGVTTVVEATPEMPILATNTIPERCRASLAVSGGRIYLRTESRLYCIGSAPGS
jgi:outer membrane protein assembly factor BamB